jgi:hypothetical protein
MQSDQQLVVLADGSPGAGIPNPICLPPKIWDSLPEVFPTNESLVEKICHLSTSRRSNKQKKGDDLRRYPLRHLQL